MEATGGYEQRALALLSEQGLPVAILNPRAVRRFADSMGQLEKTDRLDAGMIAWYAQTRRSQPVCLSSASQQQLRALVTRLRQLTEVRTAQLNQSRLVTDPAVVALIDELLAVVARQIRELETSIAELSPRTRSGINSIRSSVPSRAWPIAPWPVSWPRCRRSARLSNKTISKLAGRRSAGPRQRQTSGQARGARRPRLGARNPVHRCQCGRSSRARLHRLPAASQRRRQAAQSHPHRLGSQTAGAPQRQSSTGSPAARPCAQHNFSSRVRGRLNSARRSRGCGKAENAHLCVFRGAMRRLFHNPLPPPLTKQTVAERSVFGAPYSQREYGVSGVEGSAVKILTPPRVRGSRQARVVAGVRRGSAPGAWLASGQGSRGRGRGIRYRV